MQIDISKLQMYFLNNSSVRSEIDIFNSEHHVDEGVFYYRYKVEDDLPERVSPYLSDFSKN